MSNFNKEENDFFFHYQCQKMKENTNVNNFVKCDLKRKSIHQLIQVAQRWTNNETTCHVLRNKVHEYSSVVDKQDGVNNYSNEVVDLVSHNVVEAREWCSGANATDLLKEFLQPLPGECYNKSTEGCASQKPSELALKAFIDNKRIFSNISPRPDQQNGHQKPTKTIGFFPADSCGSLKKTTVRPVAGVNRPAHGNGDSSMMKMVGSRVFGPATKSKGRSMQTNPPFTPSFRTAGTELKLQNSKKYGHQGGGGEPSGSSSAYGAAKKSLGGRSRCVNSKFVPPVKPDSQEDGEAAFHGEGEDLEDERLRLIDPKLVELIRSEIMDYGPPVGWEDIAGLQFVKATIQEIVVLPMLRADIFTGLRRPPKGILLFGPPGTGKTLIGKCVASQSKSTFFNISASSLTSKWIGEGEKMVRTLFTLARIHQPSVVFIDEIDSLLSQRSDSEHESSRRIKTEFLVQLDGAGSGEEDRILVIGATNRPQELDEAARRRLVKRLYIPLPDHQARSQIISNLMASERNELMAEHVEELATLTEGFSGADMKTVCQEACLGPIRALSFTEMQHISPGQVRPVTVEDFKVALTRVRPSVSPGDLDTYKSWDQTYGSGGGPK